MSSSVLVVVDMQVGFVSSKSAPVVPAVIDLVDRWSAAGRDAVFTRFLNAPNSLFTDLMGWSRFMPVVDGVPNPEVAIIPELADHASSALLVLDKVADYSPWASQLLALAENRGWTDIVVCGIATESCVMRTAIGAFDRGLRPWVVTNACASHAGDAAHDAGLLTIKRYIGRNQMLTTDQVFDRVATAAA